MKSKKKVLCVVHFIKKKKEIWLTNEYRKCKKRFVTSRREFYAGYKFLKTYDFTNNC